MRTILRRRNAAVEVARRDVAAANAVLEAAREREAAATTALHREAELAVRIDADDRAVEAFAAWLPQGRRMAAAARTQSEAAEAQIVVARMSLTAARTAEAATEALLEQLTEARRQSRVRGEALSQQEVSAQLRQARHADAMD